MTFISLPSLSDRTKTSAVETAEPLQCATGEAQGKEIAVK
jgi:hypothetical protein